MYSNVEATYINRPELLSHIPLYWKQNWLLISKALKLHWELVWLIVGEQTLVLVVSDMQS